MLHASNHPVRRPWRSRAGLLIAAFVAMTAVASPAATAKTVVTGSHTCVVTTSGKVLCWGLNEDGQLGDGTTTKQPRPVEVVGIDDATELVSGNRSTCALRADGTVSCWGDNDLGQLGDGTAIDALTPVTVAGLSNVVAISGDGGPLCALKGDGSVACWGYGMPGVFNGMFQWSAAPVEVSAISGAVDLSVSGHEICAIGRAATTCWTYYPGSGSSGPYGGSSGSATYSSTPVAVPNSTDIQQRSGSCSLLATGQIGCEGRNSDGELGNGIRGFYELPRGASVVKGVTDARAVSGLCAVVPPGTVLCWGHPLYGGTINGGAPSPDPRTLPAPLQGLTNVRSLSGARENGCADNTAGELFCWGSNTDGRLGNGTQVPSSSPVQVAGVVVAASARDAVTPVRSGETDLVLSDVIPPTTPVAGSTTPTTPEGDRVVARVLPVAATPKVLFSGRTLILSSYPVALGRRGVCPRNVAVTVRASDRSKRRTFRVTASPSGECTVSGTIQLTGKLRKAKTLRLELKPKGDKTVSRRVGRA